MFIKLTKITSDRFGGDRFNDTDEPGEGHAPETTPVVVNVEAIRCFYPRKENKPGTRITFTDGGGFAVTEDSETVSNRVREAA
jgi:uncharacterized protein YlzI (FlbEa/FlbD family)